MNKKYQIWVQLYQNMKPRSNSCRRIKALRKINTKTVSQNKKLLAILVKILQIFYKVVLTIILLNRIDIK